MLVSVHFTLSNLQALRRKLEKRHRSIKLMIWLEKRGRIPKGYGIPKMPNPGIERSETQTVSKMVRCEVTGRMQIVPKRRSAVTSEEQAFKQGTSRIPDDIKQAETLMELPVEGNRDSVGEGGLAGPLVSKMQDPRARTLFEEPHPKRGLLGRKFCKENPTGYNLESLPDVAIKDGKLLKVVKPKKEVGVTKMGKNRKKPQFM